MINWLTVCGLWTQQIAVYHKQNAGMTVKEAKVEFLKLTYKWPTFGSAFFEVKVTSIYRRLTFTEKPDYWKQNRKKLP